MLRMGFSRSNLIRIRQFYLAYPKGATLSHLLGWSHIVELLKIDDPLERGFYEQQTVRERSAVRELVRQKQSALFLRRAALKDKAGILQLAAQGQLVEQSADLLREWVWDRPNHPSFNPVEFDGIKYRRAPQEVGGGIGMAVSLGSNGNACQNLPKSRGEAALGRLPQTLDAREWK